MKRRQTGAADPRKVAPLPGAGDGGDNAGVSQSADYTVFATTDDNGLVLTSVEVAAIFWGRYWSSTPPPPAISSDTYYRAFTGLVTGPYMTRLRQYRGVGPGTMLGKFINDSSDPSNGYSDDDVINMLTTFFQDNAGVPAPAAGHQRFYAVVTPPRIDSGAQAPDGESLIGNHQSFLYSGVTTYYCWVDGDGGLTDDISDGVINAFSHELVEACTDPLNDGIHVNGQNDDTGILIDNDEIADTCGKKFAIVDINGVTCNVQCYWSDADKACIIPLGRLSFLAGKNTFGRDEVQQAVDADGGVFPGAFRLALDDFSLDTFRSFNVGIPTPAGPFAGLPGVTISPSPAKPGDPAPAAPIPFCDHPADTALIQQIRFSFDVTFGHPLTTPFPASGSAQYALTATFTTNGATVPGTASQGTANFELVSGASA